MSKTVWPCYMPLEQHKHLLQRSLNIASHYHNCGVLHVKDFFPSFSVVLLQSSLPFQVVSSKESSGHRGSKY